MSRRFATLLAAPLKAVLTQGCRIGEDVSVRYFKARELGFRHDLATCPIIIQHRLIKRIPEWDPGRSDLLCMNFVVGCLGGMEGGFGCDVDQWRHLGAALNE